MQTKYMYISNVEQQKLQIKHTDCLNWCSKRKRKVTFHEM